MAKKGVKHSPPTLGPSGRKFWAECLSNWQLEDHHLAILAQACAALDRAEEARATIAATGATFVDRFGQPRVNPACKVETDSRRLFLAALRELALDIEPPHGQGR